MAAVPPATFSHLPQGVALPDKPKMLWHSNSPFTSTGYGSQTALFTPHLAEDYDVTISAFYGHEGYVTSYEGIPVLPGVGGHHGNEDIEAHVNAAFSGPRDGLVVTLMDVWVLNPSVWAQFNTASWVPVDHEPVPRPVWGYFENSGAVPIAMSRFGEHELRRAGLDPLYCPHAVDTSVYKPDPNAREYTGMPEDTFIVGMVAANKGNPSRKCFQEAFQAFKMLLDRHPEVKLYLHTEITGRFQGVDIIQLAKACGIPQKALIVCDQYRAMHFPYSDEVMASVFSSLDVLLSPSAGEGFGIPVLEAQACGTPVIVSDFSAQKELCGSGWLVKGTRTFTPINAWQFKPDVPDIYDALKQAYAMSDGGVGESSSKAVEFAADYDIAKILKDHMLPVLEEVGERFAERKPVELKAA